MTNHNLISFLTWLLPGHVIIIILQLIQEENFLTIVDESCIGALFISFTMVIIILWFSFSLWGLHNRWLLLIIMAQFVLIIAHLFNLGYCRVLWQYSWRALQGRVFITVLLLYRFQMISLNHLPLMLLI